MALGVGIVGAGPGVSALHLPTLARLGRQFRIVAIGDSGSGRAAGLASRWGARAYSDAASLLADPDIEVVAVCSPPERHAEHVRTAIGAGARAILCEKPLATTADDGRELVHLAREAGVALLVGTNHLHDAAWNRAKHELLRTGSEVRTIGATLALPPNGRYHELVTEFDRVDAAPGRAAPDWSDPAFASGVVRSLVLGLGIHDLPAVRDLAPTFERVHFARPVPPIGYAIGFRASGVEVQLAAVMLPDGPDAQWRLSIGTSADQVEVDFPPAFVHAGSATVRVRTVNGPLTEYGTDPEDSYVREWLALAALADGTTPTEYDEILDDVLYGVAVADGAAACIREAAA
ncbi:MAG: Gfo/Idh/MocA family oxidoreductase [Actinomycetota bacterium]|nr:Gfo/Idh/MocA family oxidoreductase [Actinomycetota bacterium]